jgi:hypothetical protein
MLSIRYAQPTKLLNLILALSLLLLASCSSTSGNLPSTPVALSMPGLVLYYPFNGNANDMSGSQINGQVHGTTLTKDRFGVSNHAYYFNGTDAYISFDPSKLPLGNDPRSISAWVKAESYPAELFKGLGSRPSVVGWGINDWDQLSEMQLVNGALQFHTYSKINVSSKTVLQLKEWYHLAIVYSGSAVTLYINGVEGIVEASPINTPIGTGRVGTWPDPPTIPANDWNKLGYFHGSIDDISIYNQALTSLQIKELYTEGGWGK